MGLEGRAMQVLRFVRAHGRTGARGAEDVLMTHTELERYARYELKRCRARQ